MIAGFWVKFIGKPPELWKRKSFEEFWHDLREHMLRNEIRLEWIVRD